MTVKKKNYMPWVFVILGFGATFLHLYALYRYGTFASYVDHAEPNVAFRSWRLVSGGSVYNPVDSESFLLVAYGPIIFLVNSFYLAIFGGSVLASKLGGLAASGVSLMLFCFYLWREVGFRYLGLGLFIFASFLLFAAPYSLWNRPEPHIIFFVTSALVAGSFGRYRANIWVGPVLVAVFLGLAVNLKVHSFIYFLPIIILYCSDRYLIVWPVGAVVSLVVFLAPFTLPQVSLENYMQGVRSVILARSFVPDLFLFSLRYALAFISPAAIALLIAYFRARDNLSRKDVLAFAMLTLCIGAALYPSSVTGTFWYHIIPVFPVTVALFLRFVKSLGSAPSPQLTLICVFVLAFAILPVTPQKRFQQTMDDWGEKSADAASEVMSVLRQFPGDVIEMGYGNDVTETYKFTFLKPILAFAGNPVSIDGWSDMEAFDAGARLSVAKLARISGCATKIWLIPKGEAPFAMNSYTANKKAFWPELTEAFTRTHEKFESLSYFDLWRCQDG